MKTKTILSTILLLLASQILAATWDEPWRKEIIQKAEYFVFAKVIASSDSILTIQVQKDFDHSLQGEIKIDDFYLLDLCSYSGGRITKFDFEENEEAYFFLKRGENGNYQLPTPTSGVDRVVEDKVHATYRHSYHQAALKPEIYELTYTAIWKYYTQKKIEEKDISKFIDDVLAKEAAGFGEDEIALFFEQHAALESAFLLGIALKDQLIKKFIESDNFHLQVSGLRALGVIDSENSSAYLLEYIKDPNTENFNKVIAIWSLWEFGTKKDRRKLWRLREHISDEQESFGGNLMDPRVCTYFPSPKQAIIDLKKRKRKVKY